MEDSKAGAETTVKICLSANACEIRGFFSGLTFGLCRGIVGWDEIDSIRHCLGRP
jgi:hypothetical protein